MEGGRTEQEYDEFEMLLGEIPNVTSGNPHPEDSRPTNSLADVERIPLKEKERNSSLPATFTNFYQSSQATSPSSNAAFYGGLPFEIPGAACVNSSRGLCNDKHQINGSLDGATFEISGAACVNSSRGSVIEKHQANGSLDGAKPTVKNGHQSPFKNIDREDPNQPNYQSLTSAFAELSFKDGITMEAASHPMVNYKTLLNNPFSLEGQYPSCLKKPPSNLDSGGMVIPPSHFPNTLNGMNMLSPTPNGLDKFDAEMNGQESAKFLKLDVLELKKQKPDSTQLINNFSGDMGEQGQNLSAYSGAMPLDRGMQTFQVLSGGPVPRVEFPVTPYQQQYFLDAQSPLPYMQPQQLSQSHITWRHMEEEQYYRRHQQFMYLQQLRNQQSEAQHTIQASGNATTGQRNLRQPYFDMPISHQLEKSNQEPLWNNAAFPRGFNQSDLTLMCSGLCCYHAQGFCGRGESCLFPHGEKQTTASSLAHPPPALSAKDFDAIQVLDKVGKQSFPEKILTRLHGLNSLRVIKPGSVGGHESLNHVNSNGRVFSNGHFHPNASILKARSFQLDGRSLQGSSPDTIDLRHNNLRSQPQKYNSVDEVTGRIYLMAKDQHGCRFLQRNFTEGTAEDVEKIFLEIIGHIVELMTDPFGNYLVQKLLEVCDEDQRMQILHAITRKSGDLARISCDMHGTRAVQKVIETLKSPEQFSMVVASLKPDIVTLIKDMNGNHVAQRCLQYLMPEYSEFLFEAATAHCVELATDKHGCCVLQKCLSHRDGEQRCHLISEIASNALILSQDPFGNYVVQYIFELRVPWATIEVLNQLEGNYGYLAMQKYSSNVVEKCLKYAEERRPCIIQELINNSRLDQILHDPFGNYVIQAALNNSKGALHIALVEAIRPYVPSLRTSPYGKKFWKSSNMVALHVLSAFSALKADESATEASKSGSEGGGEGDEQYEEYEVELDQPYGLKFAKGRDGGTYIDAIALGGSADKTGLFTVGDKVLATSAVFGTEIWPAAEYGRTMYTIRQRVGPLLMKMQKGNGKLDNTGQLTEKEIIRAERNSGVISNRVREIQMQNYLKKKEQKERREQDLREGLQLYKSGKYEEALEKFESVLGSKPEPNEASVASYNVACCYSKLNQIIVIKAGLSALEDALEEGYENFKRIRTDPDLANLRTSEEFESQLKRFDESFINENAINAIKSLFGFNKK
ncbi:hypothetical protein HHK36_017525 [Tetracentron sinense]|uniref:Uncharacterized protein n=1 Tax=Tetracentron sinense TaxID=13715 RepID=A0A834Z056_TETSI|nr:hypothetical protein HHK36_017525 [Tetracentron sinense]